MQDEEALVVIPLPTTGGSLTFAVAKLVDENGQPFAEAMAAVPGTTFAPPRRISLSRYSLRMLREGAPRRPALYLYEGMILAAPE